MREDIGPRFVEQQYQDIVIDLTGPGNPSLSSDTPTHVESKMRHWCCRKMFGHTGLNLQPVRHLP